MSERDSGNANSAYDPSREGIQETATNRWFYARHGVDEEEPPTNNLGAVETNKVKPPPNDPAVTDMISEGGRVDPDGPLQFQKKDQGGESKQNKGS